MLLTLLQSQGEQPPVEIPKIYQEVWIIDKRKKGEPRKEVRRKKKVQSQVRQAVEAVKQVSKLQVLQSSFAQQKAAIEIANKEIELAYQALQLEIALRDLEEKAAALQAKIRLDEYVRQEYERAVRLYQEQESRRLREEAEDYELLYNWMMEEAEDYDLLYNWMMSEL